jgi:glycerate dehydrogenase
MAGQFQKLVSFGVSAESVGQDCWEQVKGASMRIVEVADENELRDELVDADALLLSLGRGADADLISSAPDLRYIGMLGTGYGRIDLEAARRQGVTVSNVADYSTQAVAEFVFAALLADLRDLDRARTQAGKGDYDESSFDGTQVSSKTIGILGLGNIGRRVAELASGGFGAKVIYWSRSPKDTGDAEGIIAMATPEEVISAADVLSLHFELNPETDGFLGPERLALVQDGALLINTAPMELIDLPALEDGLKGQKFSFILDHSDEMDPEDAARLANYENCTVYPPIAYTTVEASAAKLEIFAQNIASFLEGSPQNVVS